MKPRTVLLEVNGIVCDPEMPEVPMRLITTGKLSGKKDAWKLVYTQRDDFTGEEDRITLSMGGGVVTMQRGGPGGTGMVFEQARRHESRFRSPLGDMALGVYPTGVHYAVDENGTGEVSLSYHMDLEGQSTGLHRVSIRFRSSPA